MELKVPFYEFLNMLLTGIVFVVGFAVICPEYLLMFLSSELAKSFSTKSEILIAACVFAITYEIGLLINRLGSVFIEPLIKKVKWIEFNDDYVLFNEKKKIHPILATLSREYASSRTRIVLYFLLTILSFMNSRYWLALVSLGLMIFYYLSCKKYSSKIVKLMQV